MNIVTSTCKVLVESKQNVDSHTLVRLQYIVEHVVGTVEECDGAYGEYGDVEIVGNAGIESSIEKIEDQHHAHDDLDDGGVEGDDVDGKQHHTGCGEQCGNQQGMSELLVPAIHIDHARREDLHK